VVCGAAFALSLVVWNEVSSLIKLMSCQRCQRWTCSCLIEDCIKEKNAEGEENPNPQSDLTQGESSLGKQINNLEDERLQKARELLNNDIAKMFDIRTSPPIKAIQNLAFSLLKLRIDILDDVTKGNIIKGLFSKFLISDWVAVEQQESPTMLSTPLLDTSPASSSASSSSSKAETTTNLKEPKKPNASESKQLKEPKPDKEATEPKKLSEPSEPKESRSCESERSWVLAELSDLQQLQSSQH